MPGFGYANHNISTIPDSAQVLFVENNNATGPGSLADALGASGIADKVIVFSVSGNIPIDTLAYVSSGSNVWILGSSAPGPINITNGEIRSNANNFFMENIRMRTGDLDSSEVLRTSGISGVDTLGFAGANTANIVIQNCSFAHSLDEMIRIRDSVGATTNISILDCIFAEPLHNSIHPTNPHSYGPLITDYVNLTMARNIHTHHSRRAPRIHGGNFQSFNNIFFNPGVHIITNHDEPANIDAIGNVVLFPSDPADRWDSLSDPLEALVGNRDTSGTTNVYLNDNILNGIAGAMGVKGGNPPNITGTRNVADSGAPVMPSSEVPRSLISNCGAWASDRDSIDQRVVDQISSLEGTYVDSQSEFISEEQPLGYPELPVINRTISMPTTGKSEFLGSVSRNAPGFIKLPMKYKSQKILYCELRDSEYTVARTLRLPVPENGLLEVPTIGLDAGVYSVNVIENKINSTGNKVRPYLLSHIRVY